MLPNKAWLETLGETKLGLILKQQSNCQTGKLGYLEFVAAGLFHWVLEYLVVLAWDQRALQELQDPQLCFRRPA